MRRILFHRQFLGYAGGHGKVRDYVGHVDAHGEFEAETWLTPDSVADDNPWVQDGLRRASRWEPGKAGVLFLAGLDWLAVPDDRPERPVINLVQALRHADPGDERRPFLRRPAVRLCVSQAVADAILATGEVNGPVHVIPAGLDLPQPHAASASPAGPGPRVVIAGGKAPALASGLVEALPEFAETLEQLPAGLPRQAFLARIAAADIAVLLPHEREGFYLPALEAMALGTAVVTTDAGGNREYLQPGINALVPVRRVDALADAVRALRDEDTRQRLCDAGLDTAARFSLSAERRAFHGLLDRLDLEWAQCRHAC